MGLEPTTATLATHSGRTRVSTKNPGFNAILSTSPQLARASEGLRRNAGNRIAAECVVLLVSFFERRTLLDVERSGLSPVPGSVPETSPHAVEYQNGNGPGTLAMRKDIAFIIRHHGLLWDGPGSEPASWLERASFLKIPRQAKTSVLSRISLGTGPAHPKRRGGRGWQSVGMVSASASRPRLHEPLVQGSAGA